MYRKVVTVGVIAIAMASFAVTPTVTDVVAKQRYPWNGLVDITCNVSGINGTTNGLKFAVAAVGTDFCTTNKVLHFCIVQDGTNSTDYVVHTNGDYRLVWDARVDLGQVIYSNMVVRVSIVDIHDKVQLWEGGPYWATTNIGAEKPEEYGYYFWWGDSIGYKRVNDVWVASDGSSSNFSFSEENALTCGKDMATLQSEGWITADEELSPEHDAAHVQWGGSWRMPTYDELSDLYGRCSWNWTTMNGVKGYLVSGRGNYASKSIFLPCAGEGHGTSSASVSSGGYYWSSVTDSRSDYLARGLSFSSSGQFPNTYGIRYYGFSVRPVQGFAE